MIDIFSQLWISVNIFSRIVLCFVGIYLTEYLSLLFLFSEYVLILHLLDDFFFTLAKKREKVLFSPTDAEIRDKVFHTGDSFYCKFTSFRKCYFGLFIVR